MKKILMLILILVCFSQCNSSPENKISKDKKKEHNIIKDNKPSNSVSEIDTKPNVSEIAIKEDIKVYNIDSIDVKPEFEKGIEKLHKFIRQNYKYPEEELQLKGIVDVNFIVEKNGNLSDIKVTKDAGFGTGSAAVRTLNRCPKWTPGKLNNQPVRVRYYLTIPIDAYNE